MSRLMRRLMSVGIAALLVTAVGLVVASVIPSDAATHKSCPIIWTPKPGGGFWRCTFSDEFNGKSLDLTKWTAQVSSSGGFVTKPACLSDSSQNVSESGGTLKLTLREEATPVECQSPTGPFMASYTTGSVTTWGKFSQAYGRYEIRAKFPPDTVAGLQEALWMVPQNIAKYGPWPLSGEIDIAEAYSSLPDRAIPFVHYVSAGMDAHVTNNYCMINNINDFHTYLLVWTPKYIQISYDGKLCIKDTWNPAKPLVKPQPFDQPFVLALTQGIGVGANAFSATTTADTLPATTEIDYVRVWS